MYNEHYYVSTASLVRIEKKFVIEYIHVMKMCVGSISMI